jgi:hypothetical protein
MPSTRWQLEPGGPGEGFSDYAPISALIARQLNAARALVRVLGRLWSVCYPFHAPARHLLIPPFGSTRISGTPPRSFRSP